MFNEIEALPNRNDLAKLGDGAAALHAESEAFVSEQPLYRLCEGPCAAAVQLLCTKVYPSVADQVGEPALQFGCRENENLGETCHVSVVA